LDLIDKPIIVVDVALNGFLGEDFGVASTLSRKTRQLGFQIGSK